MKDFDWIYHREYKEQVEMLTMEQRGMLFTALNQYAEDGTTIDGMDDLTKMLFSVMRARMERDLEKYETRAESSRENGRKGGRKKNPQVSIENPENPQVSQVLSENPENLLPITNTNNQNQIEEKRETPKVSPEKRKRFTPPTVEEVRQYCQERHNSVDPEKFCDFYASKGWKVGRDPMKDWKASVRTWEKQDSSAPPGSPAARRGSPQTKFSNFQSSGTDWDRIGLQVMSAQRKEASG